MLQTTKKMPPTKIHKATTVFEPKPRPHLWTQSYRIKTPSEFEITTKHKSSIKSPEKDEDAIFETYCKL